MKYELFLFWFLIIEIHIDVIVMKNTPQLQ